MAYGSGNGDMRVLRDARPLLCISVGVRLCVSAALSLTLCLSSFLLFLTNGTFKLSAELSVSLELSFRWQTSPCCCFDISNLISHTLTPCQLIKHVVTNLSLLSVTVYLFSSLDLFLFIRNVTPRFASLSEARAWSEDLINNIASVTSGD